MGSSASVSDGRSTAPLPVVASSSAASDVGSERPREFFYTEELSEFYTVTASAGPVPVNSALRRGQAPDWPFRETKLEENEIMTLNLVLEERRRN